LSFLQFREYLAARFPDLDFDRKILPTMKKLVAVSLKSVAGKMNPKGAKYCFEIFGYDFMIDADGGVILIEVNTNPCLDESSPLLQQLIPRMIDEAFKLTLDVVFPPRMRTALEVTKVLQLEDGNLWESLDYYMNSS
jgi:hypothetical protein